MARGGGAGTAKEPPTWRGRRVARELGQGENRTELIEEGAEALREALKERKRDGGQLDWGHVELSLHVVTLLTSS